MSLKNFEGYATNEERVAAKGRRPWQSPSPAQQAQIQAHKQERRNARSGEYQARLAAERQEAERLDALDAAARARAAQDQAAELSRLDAERIEREGAVSKLAGDTEPAPRAGDAPTGDPQPETPEVPARATRTVRKTP